jgi:tetratricopeptide (TPR) repeat protein
LFCLENARYEDATRLFRNAIGTNSDYLPALEALAETSLRRRDLPGAVAWSRRILQIDPAYQIARQTLARIAANH